MRALVCTLLIASLPAVADTAPDFAAVTSTGEAITFGNEVRKRPTVLFFWASWCPYCKALMPHLQSIRLEHGDAVRIIAVHFRDDADGTEFIETHGYDFTVIPDGDAIAKRFGVHGTPGVIVADRDLAIRFDLRTLPRRPAPAGEDLSHREKAALRAPWWAAELRKSLAALDSP